MTTTDVHPLHGVTFSSQLAKELRKVGFKDASWKDLDRHQHVLFEYFEGTSVTLQINTASDKRFMTAEYRAKRYDGNDDASSDSCPYGFDVSTFHPVVFEAAIRLLRKQKGRCDHVTFVFTASPATNVQTVLGVFLWALKLLDEQRHKV